MLPHLSVSVPTQKVNLTPYSQCVALVFINRLLQCMYTQTGSGWWPPIDTAARLDARGKAAGFGLCCLPRATEIFTKRCRTSASDGFMNYFQPRVQPHPLGSVASYTAVANA